MCVCVCVRVGKFRHLLGIVARRISIELGTRAISITAVRVLVEAADLKARVMVLVHAFRK